MSWTRTPLTVWFTACRLLATRKDAIATLRLQRTRAGCRRRPSAPQRKPSRPRFQDQGVHIERRMPDPTLIQDGVRAAGGVRYGRLIERLTSLRRGIAFPGSKLLRQEP